MLIRRATLLTARALRQAALQVRYARRWQSQSLKASTSVPELHYENFYERLLKLYGSDEGRISVPKFLEVRKSSSAVTRLIAIILKHWHRTWRRLGWRRAILGSNPCSRGYRRTFFNSTAVKKLSMSSLSEYVDRGSSHGCVWGVCDQHVYAMLTKLTHMMLKLFKYGDFPSILSSTHLQCCIVQCAASGESAKWKINHPRISHFQRSN